ncbi:MAG: VWA domain-containing protein [Polyangiaceae bacterium]
MSQYWLAGYGSWIAVSAGVAMSVMRWFGAILSFSLVQFACSSGSSKEGSSEAGGLGSNAGTGGSATSPTTEHAPSGGRGSQTDPGVGVPAGDGGTTATGTESSCGVVTHQRESKRAEIILVLDRSSSMQMSPRGGATRKWDMVLPAIENVVTATNDSIGWGLKFFPEGDGTISCAAESIVPLIHVPVAEDNAAKVIDAIDASGPDGTGTPTADAIKFATAHLAERSAVTDNQKFILLATDGEPTCPTRSAVDDAIDAVSAALDAGYPTFVIGVDTSGNVATLNQLARAGGRPREATAEDDNSFYLASTQSDLEAALASITSVVVSCVFPLEPPPPVPDNIAVDFSGARAERDPTKQNGWEYTKADHSEIEVYGEWCDRIKREASNKVQISYGCPNVPIPLLQ